MAGVRCCQKAWSTCRWQNWAFQYDSSFRCTVVQACNLSSWRCRVTARKNKVWEDRVRRPKLSVHDVFHDTTPELVTMREITYQNRVSRKGHRSQQQSIKTPAPTKQYSVGTTTTPAVAPSATGFPILTSALTLSCSLCVEEQSHTLETAWI